MTMKRYIFILLMAIAFTAAADVTFTVKPPRGVYEGDKFPVTFKLTDAQSNSINVQQISGCTLLYGPSTSTSQSYQIINGRTSSSSTVEFTYFYRAGNAGTYTIPAASVTVDGKKMSTKPVTFTVQPRSDRDKPASQRPVAIDDPDTQAAGRQVKSNDVFVRIILSRTSAYEQEAIACTIKLYTKYSISSFMPTKQPSFDGFLIQEVDLQPSLNEIENYNGQEYMTAVLKKCIIFPQKSGRLTINSGNYDISVVQYDNVNMGMFQVRQPREAKIKVSSNSAAVDILPLPQPQPEGFFGAVGKFTVDSKLVGNSFRTNDPATLIYTVSGTGNIKYVKEPVIDFPSEFEQYTPKSDIRAEVRGNDVTGSMTVEYTFVPQSVGDFKIGSDKFVYFDPTEKKYVTLSTPTYDIKVAKGVSAPATTEKKDIETKNTDIRHIHQGDKNPQPDHTPVVMKLWYWLIYAVALFGLIASVAIYGRRARLNADVAGRRQSKANKVARKRLKAAAGFMNSGDSEKFYAEMLKALWGYLSDKLSIPVSQLSRDNIVATLTEKGCPAEVSDSLIAVLDDCEMARYTPDSSSRMDSIFNQGAEAINRMEDVKLNRK
jgi:hypothetical protein